MSDLTVDNLSTVYWAYCRVSIGQKKEDPIWTLLSNTNPKQQYKLYT